MVTDNGRGEKLLYGYPERYFASLRRLEQGGELKAASEGYEGFSNRWGYQVWTLPLSFRASSRLVAVGVEPPECSAQGATRHTLGGLTARSSGVRWSYEGAARN